MKVCWSRLMTHVWIFFHPTATAYGRRPKFVRAEHSATAEGKNSAYGPTLASRNNFRVTKKFLITKFNCICNSLTNNNCNIIAKWLLSACLNYHLNPRPRTKYELSMYWKGNVLEILPTFETAKLHEAFSAVHVHLSRSYTDFTLI